MKLRRGIPVVLVAAVAAAEVGVLLLRPREGVIQPAPVSAGSYFSEAQLERAQDFRGPQRALGLARLALEVGLLVVLVRRPPRVLLRIHRRPIVAGAATGAALAVALAAVTLPVSAAARARSVDVGLATQSWPAWAGDVAKATAVGAVGYGIGGAFLAAAMRRFPRRWWAAGAAGTVVAGIALTYASPLVIEPLFNRFEPLPQGQTRGEVFELARRAGVDVGEVYRVDASRRTTAANAYVAGLGATKRVVLYDNLLTGFSPEEIRLVVAHELAHVRFDDVRNGLVYLALVSPFGWLAIRRMTVRWAPRADGEPRLGPSALPAAALALTIVAALITTVSNQLSRRVEARADSYSLQLTRAPEAFISFERGIALRNVSDPDPPGWITWLLATHPPTVERIGIGVAFARARESAPEATGDPRRGTRGGS